MSDLFISEEAATDAEVAAVDAVIPASDGVLIIESERLVRGGQARRNERRNLLLPALHALQAEVGWISPGGSNHIAHRLQVPPAEVFGVASFYELFRVEDPGHAESVTHICVDPACRIAGAQDLIESTKATGANVHASPCLGQCERAPAVFIQGRGEPDVVPADTEHPQAPIHQDAADLTLLARIGRYDPTSLDGYRSVGGYAMLAKAIEMGADAVITAVTDSGLSGRGGAAFPTGIKWRGVADQTGRPKHVIANCDESEPGTFKDRILMEHDPFAVIEALTIAGITTGAEIGWIYIRGEYPLATERINGALNAARGAGLLGDDVAGSGQRFDIELRRGAGAYICGEETALFASIEGFRGEPRNKPPFPTTHGLFREPTAINNPETLLNVLPILEHGADAYRAEGTDRSPGTKLYCLSGNVASPGLYEFAFGTSLGDALAAAGGVTGELQAILMGGAAGSFVGPEALGMALTLEDSREAGTTLGSGVIMALNDTVDMTDVVVRITEFFRTESCGQCVPCRVGTVRQHEVMVELSEKGSLAPARAELIDDMALAMADASICGLGHTASGAVQSAIKLGLIGGSP